MFSYYDAWFMNESLAFYLSTNTFSNPVFNAQHHQATASSSPEWEPEEQGDCSLESVTEAAARMLVSNSDQQLDQLQPTAEGRGRGKTTTAKAFAATKQRCLSFRDSLAFSVKSKIYVLELNFKRRLQRLRRFADERLPWVFSSSSRRNERNTMHNFGLVVGPGYSDVPRRTMSMAAKAASLAAASKYHHPNNYHNLDLLHQLQQQQHYQVRETIRGVESDRDKFWRKIGPHSLESFGVQKEKILSRLERTLQAKRQMGLASEQQQKQQLFNFNPAPGHLLYATAAPAATNNFSHSAARFQLGEQDSRSSSGSSGCCSDDCSNTSKRQLRFARPLGAAGSSASRGWLIGASAASDASPTRQTSLSGAALLSAFSTSSMPTSDEAKSKVQNSDSASRRKTRRPTRWSAKCTWRRRKDTVAAASSGRLANVAKAAAAAAAASMDAASSSDDADSKKLCIVCYTNSPNIVTLPCKHHDICSDCFIEIIYVAVKHNRYPLKCVLCRQKIEKIRCSRRLLLRVIEKNRVRP